MSNMLDYLDWRGDLSLAESGFNEVDNLLLSVLSYVDLSGIVPEAGDVGITAAEAAKIFFRERDIEKILHSVSFTKEAIFVLQKMGKSRRFAHAILSHYQEEISEEEQTQFCALTIELADGSRFLSFSGTDNTIVGWREDFNMAFLDETPGQHKALDYLCQRADEQDGSLRLGGHSKGGNLAVYAAMHCTPQIRRRITAVYNNDGPGFSQSVIESEAFKNAEPLVHSYMPETSIVGVLFEHSAAYEVVSSEKNGIKQHDCFSWEVLGCRFVRGKDRDEVSRKIEETMKNWLAGLDLEQRELIVNSAFELLDQAGIKVTDDFVTSKFETFQKLLKAREELPSENGKVILEALRDLMHAFVSSRT